MRRRASEQNYHRECSDYTGAFSDLAIQTFNDIVCLDPRTVFGGETAVCQCFFNAVFHFLHRFLQPHLSEFDIDGLGFLSCVILAFLCMDRLEHFCYLIDLGMQHD